MNINHSQLAYKILKFATKKPFNENVCYLVSWRAWVVVTNVLLSKLSLMKWFR